MIRPGPSTCLFLILLSSAASAATRVTVEPLEHFLVFPERSAPASVISLNDASISAQISAQIEAIPVNAGDAVSKGETLIQLDCRDARLAHQAATARLSLAEKNAKRARSLKKSSSIAEQTFNQALTDEIQASVNERQTALQLRRCRVKAPFTGIIVHRLAAVGELAAIGTPLLTMLDTNAVELVARLPERDLQTITGLQQLWFHFDNRRYKVSIRGALPQIDPASKNREIRLVFTDKKALPGSSGRLRWTLATPHIPPALLSQRDGKTGILIASDGKAVFHPLKNALIGHPTATTLPADTRVIVDGRFGLENGDPIEIVE